MLVLLISVEVHYQLHYLLHFQVEPMGLFAYLILRKIMTHKLLLLLQHPVQ